MYIKIVKYYFRNNIQLIVIHRNIHHSITKPFYSPKAFKFKFATFMTYLTKWKYSCYLFRTQNILPQCIKKFTIPLPAFFVVFITK